MALIKCPECGKEISDKASACIHCGFPLALLEKKIKTNDVTQSKTTFVDKLRYEHSEDKLKSDLNQHTTNFINEISQGILELAENANRIKNTHITGYLHFGGYDPGDCIPILTSERVRARYCVNKSLYYDIEVIRSKVNENLRNAGFSNYRIEITKDRHYEYGTKITWTGRSVTTKKEADGEDYFVWIDVKW